MATPVIERVRRHRARRRKGVRLLSVGLDPELQHELARRFGETIDDAAMDNAVREVLREALVTKINVTPLPRSRFSSVRFQRFHRTDPPNR